MFPLNRSFRVALSFAALVMAFLLTQPTAFGQIPDPFSDIPKMPDPSKRPSILSGGRIELRPMRDLPSPFDGLRDLSEGFGGKPILVPGRDQPNDSAMDSGDALSPGGGLGGLRLPLGPVEHPVDQNVYVRDDSGRAVVARYHVGVGNVRIVMLPDGKLKVLEASQMTPTKDAFEALSVDQVRDAWLADERLASLNMKAIESRHFLFLYNTSEVFARSTRTILESMYPAVRKYFSRTSIDVHEPDFPLVILAFATDEQYQEFKRMPGGVVAYYDTIGNHVALYEQSDLSKVAPDVAVKNAISTIAHEGVHQILHNIGVQERLSRWPMWLSEGLPEFFAPTSITQNAKWKGLGATNDLRMKELVTDLQKGPRLGSGSRLSRLVDLKDLESSDYAMSWGVVHWMARQHREELFKCIAEAAQQMPLNEIEWQVAAEQSGGEPAKDALFETHMGTDFAAMEKDLSKYLGSLRWVDPAENQTHYLVVSGSQVTLTTSPETVKELKRETPPLRTFRFQTYPNRTLAMRAMKELTGR